MTVMLLTQANHLNFVKCLELVFPSAKWSHIQEAAATGLKHRSHSTLLARIKRRAHDDVPDITLVDVAASVQRLIELDAGAVPPHLRALPDLLFIRPFEGLWSPVADGHAFGYRLFFGPCGVAQFWAWRSIMISALNGVLEPAHFVMAARPIRRRLRPSIADGGYSMFSLGCDMVGRAHIAEIGGDFIHVKVTVRRSSDEAPSKHRLPSPSVLPLEASATLDVHKKRWGPATDCSFYCANGFVPMIAGHDERVKSELRHFSL